MSPFTKIAFTFAAATGFALPAVASANTLDTTDYYTSAVNFGDLDLASKEGRTTLDLRLYRAANRVCKESSPVANAQCKSRVRAQAAPAVKVAVARAANRNLAVRETRNAAIVGN